MANYIEAFEAMYSERGLITDDPKFIKMSRLEYAQWALQSMHKPGFTGIQDKKEATAMLMAYIQKFSAQKPS